MRFALVALLALHGLIHVMGFAKAFDLAALPQLTVPISRPLGIAWLFAAVLFLVAAVLLGVGVRGVWALPGLAAVVLSQYVIVRSWGDAKVGTVANVLVLLPILVATLDLRPSSLHSLYRAQARQAVTAGGSRIEEADLRPLPEAVRRYLRQAGVVGKPRVKSVRARFSGGMKSSHDGDFMTFTSEQVNVFAPAARYFFMEASLRGVPFAALHRFEAGRATMDVRIASVIPMIHAEGKEMNQSETVTLFNDLCILAPAALVDATASGAIRWTEVDAHVVDARFENAGQVIGARLTFDDAFQLTGFVSEDRFQSEDGVHFQRYPWSTPLRDYRDFGGVRLASHGDATWIEPGGAFVYGRFDLQEVSYDPALPTAGR